MRFLIYFLITLNSISRIFKVRGVFRNSIEGRPRNPAFPEQGRFTDEESIAICKSALRFSRQLRRTMPKKETFGGKQMVRGAVGAVAIYRGLRDFGIEHAYAIELGGDIGYQFYKSNLDPFRRVARLFARNPAKQTDLMQRLIIKLVLKSPDYDIVVCNPPSGLEYDILRCPMCDYVKTFGAEEMEFFQKNMCTYDWPIAEYCVKGGYYKRTKTLSNGDEMCDQKWLAN
jgi:hypothetical protein